MEIKNGILLDYIFCRGGTEGPSASCTSGVVLRNSGDGSKSSSHQNPIVIESTPRLAIKGFRQKLGKAIATSSSSKESSPVPQKGHNSLSSSTGSPKNSRKESQGDGPHSNHHHQFPNGSGSKATSYQHHSSSSRKTSSSSRGGSSASAMTKNSSTVSGSVGGGDCSGNLISENGSGSTSNSTSSGASFLRQPKTGSSNATARDSKNRVSGTGIPTRNSLIEKAGVGVSGGMISRESTSSTEQSISVGGNNNLININNATNNINNNINSVSTTSLNSSTSSNTMSSGTTATSATGGATTTNGVLQSLGNGTGIPKPTAAVKGTTKQSCSSQKHPPSTSVICSENNGSTATSTSNNKKLNNKNSESKVAVEVGEDDPPSNGKPEGTSCSSRSESRSNLSQNSFSSEKSLCSNAGSGGGNGGGINKTSTSSSLKSANDNSSANGVTVALVSPMPSLTNSVSNTASVSSIESNSGGVGENGGAGISNLSQSQFSTSSISQSNSNSNSSDVTVMLASKYQQQQQQLRQQSSLDDIADVDISANSTVDDEVTSQLGSPPENSANNKTSPLGSGEGFVSSTASGSSSMGSLKGSLEMGSSSSGNSLTSPTCVGIPEEETANVNQKKHEAAEKESVTSTGNTTNDNKFGSQDNGNSVIPECDEEDVMLNVKPMEPLLRNSPYGYIKSPPGTGTTGLPGNSPSFFPSSQHHQKTSAANFIQMRRTGKKSSSLSDL